MISFDWPGPIPDLPDYYDGFPLLHVKVTTPRDQAALHRDLARLGYMPQVLDDAETEWRFDHPDGERP